MTHSLSSVPIPTTAEQAADAARSALNQGAVDAVSRRAIKIDDFREQYFEAKGRTPEVRIEGISGRIYTIPHPQLLGDEATQRIADMANGVDLDKDEDGKILEPPTISGKPLPAEQIRIARAILGEEEHAAFVTDGGSSNMVAVVWEDLTKDLPRDPKSA